MSGVLAYTDPRPSDTSRASRRYWSLEEKICDLELRLHTAVTASGALFAGRRELYPLVPDGAADDLYVCLSVLCNGYRVTCTKNFRAIELADPSRNTEFHRKYVSVARHLMHIAYYGLGSGGCPSCNCIAMRRTSCCAGSLGLVQLLPALCMLRH